MLRSRILAAFTITVTGFYAGAQTLAAAPGAQVTTLSPRPGTWSEPSVAVNPRNPRQVVVVFQYTAQAAWSEDAGHTWTLAQGVAPPQYKMSGDVSITFDNQGHAILGCIAFDKLGTFNYWAHNATRNGIFLKRSFDGGKTWESQLRAVVAQPTAPGIPFEDKPYFVADTSKSRFAGNLYVGWTRWTIADSQMLFSRSTDDGVTWSHPIEIARDRGLPRDDNGALEGFDGAVGPDGTVYGVWAERNKIDLVESHDGGRRFSPARDILSTAPIMFAIDGMDRANGFPQIALDPRGGRLGGPIYVTWSDYRNGEVDIFCSVSSDHGRTWSSPVQVNNDSAHDGADHFFQWLAVDPVSGAANVVFYDRRQDPKNKKQIVVLARSTNGGKSFSNYAWTATPFDPEGVFIGDYLGLAAWGNRVYGSWAFRSGTEDKTTVQVGVADFGSAQPLVH
ncbi:MAG TPA: sialidase family protein [Acidobacteriaceae bacterium]|nr:sialidase family protein [Acidobacteriaceae bacterium]